LRAGKRQKSNADRRGTGGKGRKKKDQLKKNPLKKPLQKGEHNLIAEENLLTRGPIREQWGVGWYKKNL